MDKYINKIVGQYKIIEKCQEKHNDGHSLYNAICIKCGYVRNNTRIKELKDTNTDCNHRIMKIFWYSKHLKFIFETMIQRCYRHSSMSYNFYGAKGICIYEEWLNNKESFNDWVISNGYDDGLTIDRIDETKDYCPENCRWITREMNSKWKSTTNRIEVNGILDSGKGWSKRLGFNCNYINKMIRDKGLDYTIIFISSNFST